MAEDTHDTILLTVVDKKSVTVMNYLRDIVGRADDCGKGSCCRCCKKLVTVMGYVLTCLVFTQAADTIPSKWRLVYFRVAKMGPTGNSTITPLGSRGYVGLI